jgi:polyhydroxybutyrate depolymerase
VNNKSPTSRQDYTYTLENDTDSLNIDSSATYAACKNKKTVTKKLAKQDFDFLYDEKKGGLYFNENGSDKDFGDGGIIAILKGAPDLTSDNLEFI